MDEGQQQSIISIVPLNSNWPKKGVQSITDPYVRHRSPTQYLAELLMIHREPTLLSIPGFWRMEEYRKSYAHFCIKVKQFLNYCEFRNLHNAIVKNRLNSLSG